MLDTIE